MGNRNGWTDHQIAWADHAAAESAVHDTANAHDLAVSDLAYTTDDHLATDSQIREARRRVESTADAVTTAIRQFEQAVAVLANTVRLTRKQFADQAGISPNTLSGYVSRGQAPGPDGRDEHGHPWWLQSTVDGWKRPGRGARTDLQPEQTP